MCVCVCEVGVGWYELTRNNVPSTDSIYMWIDMYCCTWAKISSLYLSLKTQLCYVLRVCVCGGGDMEHI